MLLFYSLILLSPLINQSFASCHKNEECWTRRKEQRRNQVLESILKTVGHEDLTNITRHMEPHSKTIRYLRQRHSSKVHEMRSKEVFKTIHVGVEETADKGSFLKFPKQPVDAELTKIIGHLSFDHLPLNNSMKWSVRSYSLKDNSSIIHGYGRIDALVESSLIEKLQIRFVPVGLERIVAMGEKRRIQITLTKGVAGGAQEIVDAHGAHVIFEITTKHRQLRAVKECDLYDAGCCLKAMHIDFYELPNWEFLISPQYLNIYICSGDCAIKDPTLAEALERNVVPIDRHQIMKDNFADALPPMCCHPKKFDKVNILAWTPRGQVEEFTVDDLVATSCGCG